MPEPEGKREPAGNPDHADGEDQRELGGGDVRQGHGARTIAAEPERLRYGQRPVDEVRILRGRIPCSR
jgi:hypothetical protein